MPKGTDIRLGPWPGGLNLLDQRDEIDDTELLVCTNYDIDNTGVLVPRRPIKYVAVDNTIDTKYLLGTVILNGQTNPKAMVARVNAGTSYFRFIGDPTVAIENAVNSRSGVFKSVVQYGGKLWYIPGDASSVGASSPAALANTFSAIATMPWGDYGFVLKDRLFIVRKSTSELYFSTPTAFEPTGTFPAPWSSAAPNSGGVIQVNPGDNQPITKVVVVNNQIVIFKRDATYILSFTSSPTGDGVLRQVSADQGALDAITYNNEIYCYNSRSVFKFVNGYFQDIGLKLNLSEENVDTLSPTPRINVVGKTLLIGSPTTVDFNYAMNLDTGSWSNYNRTANNMSLATGTIFSRSDVGTTIFFGDGNTVLHYINVIKSREPDTDSTGTKYLPSYEFKTKEFSFDDSEVWKRLYSWHLDSYGIVPSDGRAVTFINGSNFDVAAYTNTSDATDLIGMGTTGDFKSYRFKTTSLGYRSFTNITALDDPPGLIVRGIRAVIGAKAPVSV